MIPEPIAGLDLPDSYDDINQTLKISDMILTNAVGNAKTLFHSPTVSSIDDSGINSRVMVLREFNLKKRFMRFHTDYGLQRSNNIRKIILQAYYVMTLF